MALATALEKLKKKREEYDDALKEITREKIAQHLGPLIPENRRLVFQTWIPSFNDGDPCTFTLGGVALAPLITDAYGSEEAPNYEDVGDTDGSGAFTLEWGEPSTEELHEAGITKKAYVDLKRAWKALPEYAIEQAFGADVIVAIKPDGTFLIDDYYCGH